MLASRLRCADPATPRVLPGVGSAASGRNRAPCRPKSSWGRLTVRTVAEAGTAVQTQQQPGVEASLLRVGFSVRVRVGWGDTVLLTGSHTSLGEWDVTKAVPLSWSTDADGSDVWSTTCELPEHFVVRFKARPSDGALQWQPGNDSTTLASPDAAALVAADDGTVGGDAGGGQAALDVYRVNAKVGYGEHFVLVGDQPALGAWDIVRGVRLRWTGCDVWQASASLPRGGDTEYKLVRCAGDGDDIAAVDWLPGDNWTLPPLSSVHASAAGGRPVSRHVHATLPDGWWQPWYWAPELGNADALVYLPDYLPAAPAAPRVAGSSSSGSMEADAPAQQTRSMPAMSDAQRAAALADASALAAAREQSADGLSMLTGLARAAGSNAQLGAAAVKAASEGLTLDINSPGFATAAARTAVAGAGVAGVATAAAGIAGGDAAMMAAMQPVAEAAALGMLVAFGAKNLLFAEDRQRFLEATGSRQKLLKLLKDNMLAIGVAGNADVAAAVSKSAAEAGFEFDPLELLEEEGSEEMEEVARRRPAGLRVPAATAAALADEAAGSAAAVLQQDANDMN